MRPNEFTFAVNFDIENISKKYGTPLIDYYGLEYRFQIDDITSLRYLESNKCDQNDEQYKKFLFDGNLHNVSMNDDLTLDISINYSTDLLFEKFPEQTTTGARLASNDVQWIKWVKSNNKTKYQCVIKSKPYPYSPDNMLINIMGSCGIDTTPKSKQAPKRKRPLFDASILSKQLEKRRRLYY